MGALGMHRQDGVRVDVRAPFQDDSRSGWAQRLFHDAEVREDVLQRLQNVCLVDKDQRLMHRVSAEQRALKVGSDGWSASHGDRSAQGAHIRTCQGGVKRARTQCLRYEWNGSRMAWLF